MKTKTLLCICLFITLAQTGFAQNPTPGSCLVPSYVARDLWLYNTAGVIAGNRDAVVSKEYFHSKWVDLQSAVPFKKDTRFYCVFEAADKQPYAYYFSGTKLSAGVLQKIESWKKGGTLTFFVEEIQDGIRKVSHIRFVLQ